MKIIVFNPSFLGDSVLTTPLIRALKTIYPHATVDFCVRPENAALFEGLSFINKVITFDKRGSESGIGGLFSFAKKLKAEKYDIFISAHTSLRSTMVAVLSGAELKVGFAQSMLSTLYDHGVHRDMNLHEVERNLMLLAPFNALEQLFQAKEIGGLPATYTDNELLEKAKKDIEAQTGGKKIIGINPGSVWPTKRWPAENFAKVIEELTEWGFACAVIGGPNDMDVVKDIESKCNADFINLAGKTSLRELPAYISQFDMLITNDSGPMHIAVSQEVPCLALFGPTVPTLGFTPYDEISLVVENEVVCRPCGLHGSHKCKEKHFMCMLGIEIKEVLRQFRVLAEKIGL